MISSHLVRRLAFAGLALTASPLLAADVTSTWSTATSGVWNANGNWINVPALGGFPNNGNGGVATYDAVISATGSPYTVTLNTNITVEDLTLNSANATINHTAGTFTATGAIAISAGTYQLNGGTISNTVINPSGSGIFLIGASTANLLSGVTINGDLTLNTSAVTRIAGATTFGTAHLAGGNLVSLGFAPGYTRNNTVLFEGAAAGNRAIEMNGTSGTLTIGATGVMRTEAGFGGSVFMGGGNYFFGSMTLVNQGLISSQTSGRTVTIQPASLTNQGTLEALNGGVLSISAATWSSATGATLRANGSTLNLSGSWSNSGTIEAINTGTLNIAATTWSNAAGATLRGLNGSTLNLSGNWSNSGALTVDNSTLNLGGSFTTAGLNLASFSNTGGAVNLTGTLNNTASTLTLNNTTGSWTLKGGAINGGTLDFANGKSLVIGTTTANLLSGVRAYASKI